MFITIYVPAEYEKKGGAKAYADSLIDMVENFEKKWPDKFVLVSSVADINKQFGSGKILLAMGMENGSPIEGKLENLKYFFDRGIRYITLAHSENNHICDSSYDENPKWNSLSPFGNEVIYEMNRLGIMIDISHVTDSTFYQVIKISKAPVIASHSACRHFTPGWERNMSDDMIKLLAKNNGVIQINFGSFFINEEININESDNWAHYKKYLKENNIKDGSEAALKYFHKYYQEHPIGDAYASDIAANIDHVVKLVGVDHVGLGSDFEGVLDLLPVDLKDVSGYPQLIYELLKLGYSDDDIKKICSGNILRVWSDVVKVGQKLKEADPH